MLSRERFGRDTTSRRSGAPVPKMDLSRGSSGRVVERGSLVTTSARVASRGLLVATWFATGCAGPTLPGPCSGSSRAIEVLETAWAIVDRDYAVFAERLPPDLTWPEVGRSACEALPADPSRDELFDTTMAMLRVLDDGHTGLQGAGRDESAWVSEYPHYDALYRLESVVEDHYVDGPLTRGARGRLAWGRIEAGGYLGVYGADGLSTLATEGGDQAAASRAFSDAMSDLDDADWLVVDARAHEGGWDAVSVEMATWFAGPSSIAWTKAVRNGPASTDLIDDTVQRVPAGRREGFGGPVVLLTSGGTFSAGETFVLAMRTRSNVEVLGEATSGHLSDIWSARLPNRWTLTYSGERYVAPDGAVYEGVGVPSDVAVPLDVSAVAEGRDVQLEAAMARLAVR